MFEGPSVCPLLGLHELGRQNFFSVHGTQQLGPVDANILRISPCVTLGAYHWLMLADAFLFFPLHLI
jgi:hypothetical protein